MDASPTDIYWNSTKDRIKKKYKKYWLSEFKTNFPKIDVKSSNYVPRLYKVVGNLDTEIEKYLDAKELIWHENKHRIEEGTFKFIDKQLDLIKDHIFGMVSKHGTSFVLRMEKGHTFIEGPDMTISAWEYSCELTKAVRYCFLELRRKSSVRSFGISLLEQFFQVCFNVCVSISGPFREEEHEDDVGNCFEYYRLAMGSHLHVV